MICLSQCCFPLLVDGGCALSFLMYMLVSDGPLEPRRLSLHPPAFLPDAERVFDTALAQVKQRSRGASAPVACVQAVRAAAMMPYERGMARERELMATLFTSGQARALQYAFFAQRSVGKWSLPNGARWDITRPRDVRRVGVIGMFVCVCV